MLHNIHRYLFLIKSAVIVRHLYFVNKKGLLELFCLKINTIEALNHPIDIILQDLEAFPVLLMEMELNRTNRVSYTSIRTSAVEYVYDYWKGFGILFDILWQLCFENSFVSFAVSMLTRPDPSMFPVDFFSFLSLIKQPLIVWLKYILTESIAFRFISKSNIFFFKFSLVVLDPGHTSLPGVYLYLHTAGLFNFQLP